MQLQSSDVAWIDTSNRAAVRTAYLNFAATNSVDMGWTGNFSTANAGSTSSAYMAAAVSRINFVRAMAGVPVGITFDPTYSQKDQQAALMMSVNQQLSHNPPSSWIDYTPAGAEAAANSNLCSDYTSGDPASQNRTDPGCVMQYMDDYGANNAAVGHRRWLLYPQTRNMGDGDVPQSGSYYRSNALWVFDSHMGDTRPATRDNFVSWPPRGYVPYMLISARWSFSYPNANFSGSTVQIARNGITVPVRLESLANGYGENTIVFVPDSLSTDFPSNSAVPSQDTTNTVTIHNVLINGISRDFTYDVIVFDPNPNFGVPASNAGIFRQGFLWIEDVDGNHQTNLPPDRVFGLGGIPEDIPVTGDWNGSGTTKAGIFRPNYNGQWVLDWDGTGQNIRVYYFGGSGDLPVVGDWSGDRKSKIGLFRAGFLWVLDQNGDGVFDAGDAVFPFGGVPGDVPLVGDWNGNGISKPGLFRQGFLFVLDTNGNHQIDAGDAVFGFGGYPGDLPLVGDWAGTGVSQVGLFRQGFLWILDTNGNHQIDGGDSIFGLGGIPGDKPVVGKW